jgi:hypothetical protein
MDPGIFKGLEAWGPPGIIIIGLSYALIAMWKRNSVIQDARIAEANERAKQIGDLTREISVGLVTATSAINSLRDMIVRLDRQ